MLDLLYSGGKVFLNQSLVLLGFGVALSDQSAEPSNHHLHVLRTENPATENNNNCQEEPCLPSRGLRKDGSRLRTLPRQETSRKV